MFFLIVIDLLLYRDTSEKSSKHIDTNEKSSKHKDTSEKSSKHKATSEKSSKCKDTSEKVIPHSPPQRTNDIGDRIISGSELMNLVK